MFDLMLDHPMEPRFLFFGNLQFSGISTVEGGDDSNDALIVDPPSVFPPYPPCSFRDMVRHTSFSRLGNEISDVVLESRRHLERWEFGLLDGVDEDGHGGVSVREEY